MARYQKLHIIKAVTQYLSKKSLPFKRKLSSNEDCESNKSFSTKKKTTTASTSKPTQLQINIA